MSFLTKPFFVVIYANAVKCLYYMDYDYGMSTAYDDWDFHTFLTRMALEDSPDYKHLYALRGRADLDSNKQAITDQNDLNKPAFIKNNGGINDNFDNLISATNGNDLNGDISNTMDNEHNELNSIRNSYDINDYISNKKDNDQIDLNIVRSIKDLNDYMSNTKDKDQKDRTYVTTSKDLRDYKSTRFESPKWTTRRDLTRYTTNTSLYDVKNFFTDAYTEFWLLVFGICVTFVSVMLLCAILRIRKRKSTISALHRECPQTTDVSVYQKEMGLEISTSVVCTDTNKPSFTDLPEPIPEYDEVEELKDISMGRNRP